MEHVDKLSNTHIVVKNYNTKYLKGKVICDRAVNFLKHIDDESALIVFLDPPFNLGKTYCENNPSLDKRNDREYFSWIKEVLKESIRITKPGGFLYLYHLPIWAMRLGHFIEEEGLDFYHWIAIAMKNGFARGPRLYPAHYSLIMFTKGKPKFFHRPRIEPVKCRHCKKYIKDYGGYLSIIESKGINLSDIWDDITPVRHKKHKHRSANELSPIIFDRVIEMSGHQDELIVDPFVGAGGSVIASARIGMRFLVCDIIRKNCDIVCNRLTLLAKEMLKKDQ